MARPETEREWIAASKDKTVRDIEKLVSGRTAGARPSDATPPEAERRRVRLELSASSYAQWLEVRRVLTAELSGHVDDDALVRALAAKVLSASPAQDSNGRSPHQIAYRVCERCSHAEAMAGSQTVTVEPVAVEVAKCDAQVVRKGRATQTIPPRVRREVLLRHGKRCAAPGCRNAAFLHLHHTLPRAEGGTHDPDLILPLCSSHHARVHEGRLVIRGSHSSGFVFEHADGTQYGSASASPAKAALFQTALGVLTSMGFGSTEAQRLLDAASPHVGAGATIEQVLLAALRRADVPRARMVREPEAIYERLCLPYDAQRRSVRERGHQMRAPPAASAVAMLDTDVIAYCV